MTLRLLVIVGPTATGKTRLGVELAHRLGSEIISADSRQVYRGLDLGTGKDLDEYAAVTPPVPYHLIDVADPSETYTLFAFQRDCYALLEAKSRETLYRSGRVPLLMVGGSGLYVEAVLRHYNIADVPRNPELRQLLAEHSRSELEQQLKSAAPDILDRTDSTNRRRLIRGLEIAAAAQVGPVRYSEPPNIDIEAKVIAIRRDRSWLRKRIATRLSDRLATGLVDEVRGLLANGLAPSRLDELGLEYREINAYLSGRKTYEQMVKNLAKRIAQFAKRQETWFRGMPRRDIPVEWIDGPDLDAVVRLLGDGGGGAFRPGGGG